MRLFPITFALLIWCAATATSNGIDVVVDYRYDTNNFFDTQLKRDAIEAAADRFSRVITTELSAASLNDNSLDPRIGFTHPGLGGSWDVSAAGSTWQKNIAAPGRSMQMSGFFTQAGVRSRRRESEAQERV